MWDQGCPQRDTQTREEGQGLCSVCGQEEGEKRMKVVLTGKITRLRKTEGGGQ